MKLLKLYPRSEHGRRLIETWGEIWEIWKDKEKKWIVVSEEEELDTVDFHVPKSIMQIQKSHDPNFTFWLLP